MTIALRMRRKFNEFRMTDFFEVASPLIVSSTSLVANWTLNLRRKG